MEARMDKPDHEHLDVYALAMDFVVTADRIASEAERGREDLATALRRASTSIVLCLAEGALDDESREKVRLYRLARRSATECAVIVDLFRRIGLVDEATSTDARAALL